MKLLYFKQPKSHKNNGNSIAGFLCRDFLRSNSNCSLSCNYYDSEHYSSNNSISEYVIYVYRKKHFLEKDDYTTFLNMGKHGLYLSYLFSLCKEYTLDSVISQIKGVNVRSFIEKGYFMSSNNLFVRLQGSLLLIENKNLLEIY